MILTKFFQLKKMLTKSEITYKIRQLVDKQISFKRIFQPLSQ
jgi:hypothetical protein